MALSDKDIIITPNRGAADDPKIEFRGANASVSAQTITARVYPTNNGTLSFEGSAGQLFSITNSLSGTIFSVNDVSGIPSIEVLDTGLIKLAEYTGNILIGTNTDNGNKLRVAGSGHFNQLGVGSSNNQSFDFYNNGTSYFNGSVTFDDTAVFTAGNQLQFYTSSGQLRGYINATDIDDNHFQIATSGGEDIVFKDAGLSGTRNLVIRGGNSGTLAYGVMRSPLFTEIDNTSHYLDMSVTGGTILSTGSSVDTLGYNASYGIYIGGIDGRYIYSGNSSYTGPVFWNGSAAYTVWHSGNLTNLNQLTNGPGYITGYTETDTLATVTARGASTSTNVTLSGGGNQFQGHFYYLPYDSAGSHYPHFNDGVNGTGVQVNWRLYTGASNTQTHVWRTDYTYFANRVESAGDMRATSFADASDTAYYVDPYGGNARISRDLYLSGSTGGNYGNRLIIGNTDTSYTLQDGNLRPTLQLHGSYPVVSLNHNVNDNANHGPTLQFTNNGVGSQFVIGTNGTGTFLSMGYSSNATWNPHNGIAGYEGTSFFHAGSDGMLGLGSPGDWGALGAGVPAYHLHVKGFNNAVNGYAGVFENIINASNNGGGWLFQNNHANHSWGVVSELRVASGDSGTDRPSLLFSTPFADVSWSVGFVTGTDDNFRIVKNHGHRSYYGNWAGNNSGWGTEYLRVTTGGSVIAPVEIQSQIFKDSNNTNYYGDFASTSQLYALNTRLLAVNPDGNTDNPSIGTLSLWSNPASTTSTMMFKRTDQLFGTHGGVTDTYATFWNMDSTNRGWIFRYATSTTAGDNVFSIRNNDGTTTIGTGGFTAGSVHARLNIHAGSNSSTTFRDIDLYGGWNGGEGHAITATYGTTFDNIIGQMVFQHNGPGSRIIWGRLYHGANQSTYPMHLISDGSSAYLEMNTGSMRAPIFYEYNDTGFFIDPNSYSRIGALNLSHARIDSNEKFPVGHYSSGETVFEIDPMWTTQQLRAFFNTGSAPGVSWVEDSTAPGGWAIAVVGGVSVGGVYGSGFPYIPVEQDDIFYMECWIKDVSGTNGHYMGSMDFDHNFTSLGGNPGSFGYWVMSNSFPGTSWQKYTGYITGFGSSTGQFVAGTKYWTPQALFNYSGQGTSYISGWKVTKVNQRSRKIIQATGVSSGTPTTYQLQIQNSTSVSTSPDLTLGADGSYAFIQSWNSKPLLINNQGNHVEVNGQIRASSFADIVDTGYYVDPNGDTRLNNVYPNEIYNYGWFRNISSGQGLYNTANDAHFYSAGNNYWHINGNSGDITSGGLIFYDQYNSSQGNSTGRKGYVYWDSAGFGLLDSTGNWTFNVHPTNYKRVTIGGGNYLNPYDSVTGIRLMFGGSDDNAADNYYIGTNLENFGGNYNKLDIRWHTGIRIGAQPGYGGVRIYDSEDMGTVRFSVNKGDAHTRVESGDFYAANLIDRDDGNYYLYPNDISNLWAVKLNRNTDHQLQVARIRGLNTDRTGDYIHMYERVHIGYPSGWGVVDAPTYGLSVWGNITAAQSNYVASWGYPEISTNSGWGGAAYPTIGSTGGTSGSLIMLHNLHVPFRTDNARSGASGRAGMRLAIDVAATSYWDAGLIGDEYEIYRGSSGTRQFWIDSSGNNNAYLSSRAPIFYDRDNTSYFVDPSAASRVAYVEGSADAAFRGANQAVNDWDWAPGLTAIPTVNSYDDESWYIDSGGSNTWDLGVLSKRRFRRVSGLTLEYEAYLQTNDGGAVHSMVGFVGGNSTSYTYGQTPANLIYHDNAGLSVYTNGGGSGSDYTFDSRNAWYKFKTVLRGAGANHYVYHNNAWRLIKSTTSNDQNSYEYVRVLISLYRQRIYFRNFKVYNAHNMTQDSLNTYISNLAGCVTVGTELITPRILGSIGGSINCNNIMMGQCAGLNISTGKNNFFAGWCAGRTNNSGNYNIFLGSYAGNATSSGSQNIFLGTSAGIFNTTGTDNIFIGTNAGVFNSSGIDNISIGRRAGYKNDSGGYNIFIGRYAGACYQNAGTCKNIAIGHCAGIGTPLYVGSASANNISIGESSGGRYGSVSVYIGACAGYNVCGNITRCNVYIGFLAGYCATTSCLNTLVGAFAGCSLTTPNGSAFFGYDAGRFNTTAGFNTFIGYRAGCNNTTGFGNTFLGSTSGSCNTTGCFNTIIGSSAGSRSSGQTHNTFLGACAGFCANGSYNTIIGYCAGFNVTGSCNTFIGRYAGMDVFDPTVYYTGSNNIVIGEQALPSSTSVSNEATIGSTLINRTRLRGHVELNRSILEKATISATAATGTVTYDANNQGVLYYTSNATGNWTLNIRGTSGVTLNSNMNTNESLTIAFLVTNGGTAYYQTGFQIDGNAVTPKWQGGTAPSSGNTNSIDVYIFTIIKTASATFTVLASQTKFA